MHGRGAWNEDARHRLRVLGDEMQLILDSAPRSVARRYVVASDDHERAVAMARLLYATRRRRDDIFAGHPGIFNDHGWDLMLDLFMARSDRRIVVVSDACIATCAAPSTALRYIARLEERGLVRRKHHPTDRRVRIVELTDAGFSLIADLLG